MALPSDIQRFIDEQAERAGTRYDDLRAVVFNGTTKRSPEVSNTDGLVAIARGIFDRVGVEVEEIRTVDRDIPPGLWPDMREHGYDSDEFPDIYKRSVVPANILIIAGPVWLGDQSSLTRKVIERLYAYSSDVNEAGQWPACSPTPAASRRTGIRRTTGTWEIPTTPILSTGGRCNQPVWLRPAAGRAEARRKRDRGRLAGSDLGLPARASVVSPSSLPKPLRLLSSPRNSGTRSRWRSCASALAM
jgi:hypothetical protein